MHMFSLTFFLFKILALLTNQTARFDLVNTLNNAHTPSIFSSPHVPISSLPLLFFVFPVTSSSHSPTPSSPQGLSANLPLSFPSFSCGFLSVLRGEAMRAGWVGVGRACSLAGDAACERSSNLSLSPC